MTSGARAGLRRDVQGLRAAAVLTVVLNHLFNWPAGGFVGVDVFFVISGYLITDLMLRERDRTGRVSWVDFYRRRVRRIIPVAMTVLVVTVAVSHEMYPAVRARLIGQDAAWSAVFLSNWHFARVETDYFNHESLVSPLQHFWSLAVEEQFYLVWPVVVIVVSGLVWRRASYRQALGVLIGAVVLADFVYSLHDSRAHATVAYFSTPARAWELGIGALLAVSSRRIARLPGWSRTPLAWCGLGGLAASLVLIASDSIFPAPWAALPVLSCAAVIGAGIGGPARGLVVLTNPVAQYIGNVSYSLYLWHFPVIIMMRDFSPDGGAWRTVLTCATIASLTVLSFHLIEDPIRRSTWLQPRKRRTRRVRYVDALDPVASRRTGFVVVGMAVVCSAAFAGQLSPRASHEAALVPLDAGRHANATTFQGQLSTKIDAALIAAEFPSLSPSVDQLDANKAPQWKDCGTTGPWNATKCTYGARSLPNDVAVVGDSIALSWLPGLIRAFNSHGYRVHSFVAGRCPAAKVAVGDGPGNAACVKHRDWAITAITSLHPDVIVMSDAAALIRTLRDHPKGASTVQEWRGGATKTLQQLTRVATTFVLSSPPGAKNLLNCDTVRATPKMCNGSLNAPEVKQLRTAETAAADATRATYVDLSSLFCGSNGACPSFVGTTPVYVDGEHLTRQYSKYLAPGLASAFKLSTSSRGRAD